MVTNDHKAIPTALDFWTSAISLLAWNSWSSKTDLYKLKNKLSKLQLNEEVGEFLHPIKAEDWLKILYEDIWNGLSIIEHRI